jgi:hypothetical protein
MVCQNDLVKHEKKTRERDILIFFMCNTGSKKIKFIKNLI